MLSVCVTIFRPLFTKKVALLSSFFLVLSLLLHFRLHILSKLRYKLYFNHIVIPKKIHIFVLSISLQIYSFLQFVENCGILVRLDLIRTTLPAALKAVHAFEHVSFLPSSC